MTMNTQKWQTQSFLKKLDPSAWDQNSSFWARKSTFWKKTLKHLITFFIFGINLYLIQKLKLGQVAHFEKCLLFGSKKSKVNFGPSFRNGYKWKAARQYHLNFFIFNIEHWNKGKTWDNCSHFMSFMPYHPLLTIVSKEWYSYHLVRIFS